MNVLSLFNGMSCGMMALESLGVPVEKYYSAEIDKYANQAAQALFPNTIQLGDVTKWREWNIDWANIDLVTGGFPCQAWSMAGKQLGDKDERGMLFWTMLDIIKHVKHHNPKASFLIENVKMKKEFEEYITTHTENALGHVYKILINSALVSAQDRNRYYWMSFEVEQPEDKGILLKDIIERDGEYTFMSEKFVTRQKGRKCLRDDLDGKAVNLSAMEYVKNGRQGDYIGVPEGYYLSDKAVRYVNNEVRIKKKMTSTNGDKALCLMSQYDQSKNGTFLCVDANSRVDDKKTGTLTQRYAKGVENHGSNPFIYEGENKRYRKLTPRECMRLQTIPEHHIDTLLISGISNTQLYKMTGNGWTVEVINHIFKELQ